MKTMYLGEAIRQQRKLLGVSQEMVCEGLCTPMTLSRFESRRQTPSWDCATAMLQRVGLTAEQYYVHLTRTETQLVRLRKEIHAYCCQFERTCGEEQQQARANALKKLHDLECCIKEDDHINQQAILRGKASLGIYPPQKQLELLIEAILLTSPRFDLDKLDSCLYSVDEVALISQIAVRYARCGQRSKAIEIYGQLLKLVQNRTPDHGYLHLITYNYARYLALENRLEEALEISELGRNACIRQGYFCALPQFLHIEAECYYLMGEDNRSMKLYQSAYHLYGATRHTTDQEALKTDAKGHFNLVF